jgi:hypothetical protein
MTAVYCCCLSERTTAEDAGRRQMKYPSQSKLSSLLKKSKVEKVLDKIFSV